MQELVDLQGINSIYYFIMEWKVGYYRMNYFILFEQSLYLAF